MTYRTTQYSIILCCMFSTNSTIEADSLHCFCRLHLRLSPIDYSAKFLSCFYTYVAPSQRGSGAVGMEFNQCIWVKRKIVINTSFTSPKKPNNQPNNNPTKPKTTPLAPILNHPFHHNAQNHNSKISGVQQNTLNSFILPLWQLVELFHKILITCSQIVKWDTGLGYFLWQAIQVLMSKKLSLKKASQKFNWRKLK